ncbi:unnamed protein product [Brassica oleracea var. botrytis]
MRQQGIDSSKQTFRQARKEIKQQINKSSFSRAVCIISLQIQTVMSSAPKIECLLSVTQKTPLTFEFVIQIS